MWLKFSIHNCSGGQRGGRGSFRGGSREDRGFDRGFDRVRDNHGGGRSSFGGRGGSRDGGYGGGDFGDNSFGGGHSAGPQTKTQVSIPKDVSYSQCFKLHSHLNWIANDS